MRRYETIFILDPDLSEDGRAPLIERIGQLIPQKNGILVQEEHWGARKLAYAIKKKQRGYYLRLDYCGTGPLVDELERFCRIDDRVLKFMTVQLAEEANVEQIQAEMAERAAAQAEGEAPPAEGNSDTATKPTAKDSQTDTDIDDDNAADDDGDADKE